MPPRLLFTLAFAFSTPAWAACIPSGPGTPFVLVLNSYAPGLPFSDGETHGVSSQLPMGVSMALEYLDTKRIPVSNAYETKLYELFEVKYGGICPKVWITLDDAAFQFALKYRDDLFPGVPLVFGGVNDFQEEQIRNHEKITGIVEVIDLEETLRSALALRPEARAIYAVTDTTLTGRINREALLNVSKHLGIPIRFFDEDETGLSLDELLEKARRVPQGDVIYYADFFATREGKTLAPAEASRALCDAATAPIFVHSDMYVGNGALGGKVNEGFQNGSQVGRMVKRILTGGSIPPVEKRGWSTFVFDHSEMRRWGIREEDLPKGSRILNAPRRFVEIDKRLVIAGGSAILVLILSSLAVALINRQKLLAREAHRDAESRLKAVIDNSPTVVAIKDHEGRYSLINREFVRLFGARESDFLGKRDDEIFTPDEAQVLVANDALVLRRGEPMIFEERLRIDGTERTYLCTKFPFHSEKGQTSLCVMASDITVRAEAEKAMLAAKHAAEAASQAKSMFLANMSHEIRTPMNAILASADLFEVLQDAEERRNLIRTIRTGGEHLLRVVDDVLDFSKLEAGKVKLENEPFSVRTLADDCIKVFQSAARERSLSLHCECDDALADAYWGDLGRLRQILFNFLSNAIKFTPHGEVSLKIVVGKHGAESDTVNFVVQDTGPGIDPTFVSSLFEPFTQEDNTLTRRVGGTGLGLAIAMRLAKAMQGDIRVTSSPERGSEFTASIPLPRQRKAHGTG